MLDDSKVNPNRWKLLGPSTGIPTGKDTPAVREASRSREWVELVAAAAERHATTSAASDDTALRIAILRD